MTDHQLRYFIVAAETLNFTIAAEKLYMTQPALSRQIASMESELGVSLFTRAHNSVALTKAGIHLYNKAVSIYKALQEAFRETRDIDAGIDGRIHIGLLEDQILSPILTKSIHALLQNQGQVSIDIERYTYSKLIANLDQGLIDIAQAPLYDGLSNGPYGTFRLSSDAMYLAYNKEYLTIDQSYLSNNNDIAYVLGHYPVVLPSTSIYPQIIRNNLPPITAFNARYVDSLSSIPLYLSTGLAATLTNKDSLLSKDENIALIPLGVEALYQGVIWSTSQTNPLLFKLLEFIQDFCTLEQNKNEP